MKKNSLVLGLVGICLMLLIACSGDISAVESPQPTVSSNPEIYQETKEISLVTPATTPAPTPNPTPTTVPTPTPIPTPFSLFFLSDTQVYAYKEVETYGQLTQWMADNAEAHNVVSVLQSGDVIDRYDRDFEWMNAKNAFSSIKGKLPLYCVAGNHDVQSDACLYDKYLALGLCDVTEPEKISPDGRCWYETMTEGGTDFILVGIGWYADDSYVPWVKQVLDMHPDHVGIILIHNYLYNNGIPSTNGTILEENIVSQCDNVRLVLCGHSNGTRLWEKTYEGERKVHAFMYNYQDDMRKGIGYLCFLEFDPLSRSLTITNYSPILDSYSYKKGGIFSDEGKLIIEDAF